MKFILSFIAALSLCISAHSQTLILTNVLVATAPVVYKCTTPNKKVIADSVFINNSQYPTNTYFYPTTNIITATYTNANVIVEILSWFGQNQCGFGSSVLTNTISGEKFKFEVLYPTNTGVPPTNQMIALTVTGVQTNAP